MKSFDAIGQFDPFRHQLQDLRFARRTSATVMTRNCTELDWLAAAWQNSINSQQYLVEADRSGGAAAGWLINGYFPAGQIPITEWLRD